MAYRQKHWTDPAGHHEAKVGVRGNGSSMSLRLPPIPRGYVIAGVLTTCAVAAMSAWVAYPWTKEQCYRWAADRQTPNGVRLGQDVCENQFGAIGAR